MRRTTLALLAVLSVAGRLQAIPYAGQDGVQWMHDNFDKHPNAVYGRGMQHGDWVNGKFVPGDCGQAQGKALMAATGGHALVPADWKKWLQVKSEEGELTCRSADEHAYKDGSPKMTNDYVYNHLIPNLKMGGSTYSGSIPEKPYQWQRDLIHPGDLFFWYYNDGAMHGGVIIGWDSLSGDLLYGARNKGEWSELLFSTARRDPRIVKLEILRPDPDGDGQINGCRAPVYYVPTDSTFSEHWCGPSSWGWLTHREVCCWHERLGTTAPWTTNRTAYICLAWDRRAMMTWDTLVSPRVDLRGRTGARLTYRNMSTLVSGVKHVLGSTDDGATWPYTVGNDLTDEAELPWADDQQRVRLAWVYSGPVQLDKYWVLDNICVSAGPSKLHDVCIPEVRPRGTEPRSAGAARHPRDELRGPAGHVQRDA